MSNPRVIENLEKLKEIREEKILTELKNYKKRLQNKKSKKKNENKKTKETVMKDKKSMK